MANTLPSKHFYFSPENSQLLLGELNEAIKVLTGKQGTVGGPGTDFDTLAYEIVANAQLYIHVLHACRDEQEGAARLRRYFVRDWVQKYAGPTYVTTAGLGVDQTLGRSTRQSAVAGGAQGALNSKLDDVNIAFAHGSRTPQEMQDQWISDRTSTRALYGLH